MNNLSILTYTNSKASDIHKPYFERINKYFNINRHIVLSDIKIDNYDVKTIIYNNTSDYYIQMINGLKEVKTDYVIYSQEDYILFDVVDLIEINNLIKILDNDDKVSFIRLIYSGIDFQTNKYNNDLIYLKPDHNYFFSTQITIWRTSDLIKMFENSKTLTIWDEPNNSKYLMNLGKIGLCTNYKGKMVGGHYNSIIYPYIATAIVKGKWNYSEYKDELDSIFSEYNIDKEIRGIR